MKPKAPEQCLCCGSDYSGGSVWCGDEMVPDARVFYQCGGSVSYKELRDGVYKLLVKCAAIQAKEEKQ